MGRNLGAQANGPIDKKHRNANAQSHPKPPLRWTSFIVPVLGYAAFMLLAMAPYIAHAAGVDDGSMGPKSGFWRLSAGILVLPLCILVFALINGRWGTGVAAALVSILVGLGFGAGGAVSEYQLWLLHKDPVETVGTLTGRHISKPIQARNTHTPPKMSYMWTFRYADASGHSHEGSVQVSEERWGSAPLGSTFELRYARDYPRSFELKDEPRKAGEMRLLIYVGAGLSGAGVLGLLFLAIRALLRRRNEERGTRSEGAAAEA